MAKKASTQGGTAVAEMPEEKGASVAGYFKGVFEENPEWLGERSNDALLERWLADNPGNTEVPERIRNILANTKSVLRKKARGPGGKKKKKMGRPRAEQEATTNETPRSVVPAFSTPNNEGYSQLEEQIDECLTLAKNLHREDLSQVITLLRHARNQVVWKLGQ